MAIYDDVKITINLNELVEIRAKLLTQYENYASKINKGEYLDENDVDRIASELRDTLTWDTLYQMVDEAVLIYLDLNEDHYGETAGNEPAATFEQQKKNAAKFELVDLVSPASTIQVPVRKKK